MKTLKICLALLLVLAMLTGTAALAARIDVVTTKPEEPAEESPAEESPAEEPPAAEPLSPEAQQALDEGIAWFYGHTDEGFNKEAALDALQRAADAGSGEAWYYIGRLWENGCASGRYAEAMACYDRAIELGFAKGYFGKGELYREGLGVEKDPNTAYDLYTQAISLGCAGAHVGYGNTHRFGDGAEISGISAIDHYTAALGCGDYELENLARFGIARVYEEGLPDVEQDYAQALEWYSLGADAGFGSSINNIGVMYEKGWGVEPDFDAAGTWFERAAFHGDAMASYNLAWRYLDETLMEPDEETALQLFQHAAENGCTDAQVILGDVFYGGYLGMEQNFAQAMDWYLIAVEANDPSAMESIGELYYYGDDFVGEDYAQAAEWFTRAADNGSAEAMDYLGYMYIYGQGVDEDYAAALDWYVQALQNADGDEQLAETIRSELGILVDEGFTTWDELDAMIAGA